MPNVSRIPLEDTVATVLKRCLGGAPTADIGLDTDLEAMGLGSLMFATFLLDLERTLKVTFPSKVINRETFRSLRTTAAAANALLDTARYKGRVI
ncbi:hypothetical protein CDG76_35180 [Nostoc sp. 'Peltigera membranacea cyanobiont' 210A]|uniref:acyl carrier protein n=1 Tax=Nostoc sp. 'Peltigera membranacea cyanobiont' 210A TaxID=2014529 RepID=UPI000B9581CA|nr:acyl carrier protein [Nostoc sp. 'Peltigera membranacea cyanobiont' 210A]OYD89389.1 hypothetical protein CDG76_35180 [Nostoc sp. 'Peltigera membranacea cyanobiont' 210A]